LTHAYLFYGPRGSGKTTTARLVAKLLNCKTRDRDRGFHKEGEPCNTCVNCSQIDAGISLDLVEIDAASNRGIDEIRNLKEGIGVAPSGGHHRIYIIDEAHMLTPPAWNALLKTLEEPPPHAVLILATTEYEKIPPTISSRTQRFLFKKLPKTQIAAKLAAIAHAEHIKAEPDALMLIAAAAEGSLRDAESLLDQLRSVGEPIDVPVVEGITGRVSQKTVRAIAETVVRRDLAASLAHLHTLSEAGYNLARCTRDLIHYFRKALALNANPSLGDAFREELAEEELRELRALSASIRPAEHVPFVRALIRAYGEMRYSPFAAIPLELTLIEHLGAA
ncbi:MAG: DNA polymerase III subunit gamma/tau, partial [Candidatus Liptonbacteria bacterium]|nr:DNA polymerase III subunit gamma/tau [Candidatus Liptonbacteria bacterium]